jgi:subfamily B ATP-binding cassette protein MsbA
MQNLIAELTGKTIVFVTHRGSTLQYVDRAMILEDGFLMGFDTINALQSAHPNFRSLFNLDPVAAENSVKAS